MTTFEARYVHKISPRHTDVVSFAASPELLDLANDHLALGKALRRVGVLPKGCQLAPNSRRGKHNTVEVFPVGTVNHAIVIREIADAETLYAVYGFEVTEEMMTKPIEREPYGLTRCRNLYDFLSRTLRPLSAESAPRTYTLVEYVQSAEPNGNHSQRVAGA
jgi:hypothetical protein